MAQLTPAQARMLLALNQSGWHFPEIAREIGTTVQTVKNYSYALCNMAGVDSRFDLAVFCWSNGVLSCPCGRSAARANICRAENPQWTEEPLTCNLPLGHAGDHQRVHPSGNGGSICWHNQGRQEVAA